MADNIQTELGVDANVPVYANAKEIKKAEKAAKKAAKKAEKEAKKAQKREKKVKKKLDKAIEKCQKAVNKAQKEKNPEKRAEKINKARQKLEKSIEKSSEKYPVETKAYVEDKERANAARKVRAQAASQTGNTVAQATKTNEKAFDGIASAYGRETATTNTPTRQGASDAAKVPQGSERIDTGDPFMDIMFSLIDRVMKRYEEQQLAFERRLKEREEARLREQNKNHSSSGLETDALTQTAKQNTTNQTPSLAMVYRNTRGQGMV